MPDDETLLSPEDAVKFLNEERGANVTVDILRQMRRKGRVKGVPMGKRMTAYHIKDLREADISRHLAGRPKKEEDAP